MTDTPQDLLQAVDAITKPVALVHWQEDRHAHTWIPCDGKHSIIERCDTVDCKFYVCEWCDIPPTLTPEHATPHDVVRRRTEASLLDQLRDAVASDKGQGGGRKPGREQVPIDVAALALYETIDGRIRSWLDEMGARAGKDIQAAQLLRNWYQLWIGGVHVDGLERRYQTIVESWADQIRDKLQSPKRIEITAPCPACGKEWVNIGLKLPDGSDDPNDIERVRVLNAVERETIKDSYAMCAACDTVWMGVYRMRELRAAIDDDEAKTIEAGAA